MPRSAYQFQTIRSEGAILPPDLLQKIVAGEVEGLAPDSYHLPPGVKLKEAISQSWTRLLAHWRDLRKVSATLGEHDETGTVPTREKWLLPLLNEIGYGRLPTAKAPEIDGKIYPIDRFYNHVPIHLIGFKLPLDRRTKGARGAATSSPHSMLQEFLNRSEPNLWGILSNGLQIRILRDSKALSRLSYLEFDLESMFEGETYADFAILWMVAHQSRVESEKAADCWLEKWSKLSHEQGTRILSALRDGVTKAIEILGRGFVGHPRNDALRDRLRKGELSTQDFYRQLLRTVYRLLFLFVAEDRDLLHAPSASPEACDLYDRFYSTRRLRELSERMRGSKHGDLWYSLALVFDKLNRPDGCPELGLPAFGSFLWSPAAVPDLPGPAPKNAEPVANPVLIANEDLLSAVRAIAFTEDNRVLRAVDYGSKGSEELGSVYESLLELHPEVIAGNTADSSSFELRTAAGNERKTSGSYYTPGSLVQCLLDSALEPVVAETLERARKAPDGKPLTGDALRDSQEKALLALKVCDPACGSAHFLIAAAHRLGAHLARVRGGEVEPSPADYQHAVRDVISHCIYGVDINSMAVELCKVALWMEALEPGKPLSFLDHRIQCGNSLLGVTPALLAKGIPDEAFEPIEGDEKPVCRELKKRNKEERKTGQMGFIFDVAMPSLKLGNLPTAMMQLDAIEDDTIEGVKAKENHWKELVESASYGAGRMLADAWCAAFVWKKTREMGDAITESIFRRLEQKGQHDLPPWMRDEIKRLAEQYQFFHWHLAFPDVFHLSGSDDEPENAEAGWSGGFDVVLGNPPWERLTINEQEWFEARRPEISSAPNASARKRLIANLLEEAPALHTDFRSARRLAGGESHIVRHSSRYPFCGRGDINTYSVFAESNYLLIDKHGSVGCIVPSGIATDDTTKLFFQNLMACESLVSLLSFENEDFIFPGIHHATKFCLLTLSGSARPSESARFIFFARSVDDLAEEGRSFKLTASDIDLLNPNTKTCATFRTAIDCEITKFIHKRIPIFVRESAGSVEEATTLVRMFHMADDSDIFRTREELEQNHWELRGNVFVRDCETMLPLYEAKMMHHFDHRFGTYEQQTAAQANQGKLPELSDSDHDDPYRTSLPKYWVESHEVEAFFDGKWDRAWVLGWREITSAVTARTVIVCAVPRTAIGNKIPLILPRRSDATTCVCLQANLTAFVLDYAARQKVGGTSLSYFFLQQFPVLSLDTYENRVDWLGRGAQLKQWIARRMLELIYTAHDVEGIARDAGYDGPPFRWLEDRRLLLRSELDALFLHFYLGSTNDWQQNASPELLGKFRSLRDGAGYIIDTFPLVKRKDESKYGSYRTKETILSIYDEMAEAIAANEAAVAAGGQPTAAYQTRLDPPPGPPAGAAGNFLPLPEWKPGQPRPANWPRHIHAPREVHEWAIANGIDWRTLLEQPVEAPAVVVRPAAWQIDRGRAVAYTTLLLHAWAKPVAREVLEPALILMLNDGIRQAVLGRKKPKKASSQSGAATIVSGMDQFLQGLQANSVIALQTQRGRHVLSTGPQAVTLDKFPEAERAKAAETLKAMEIIGESKAMTFVKAMVDEAGLAVPTFAAG